MSTWRRILLRAHQFIPTIPLPVPGRGIPPGTVRAKSRQFHLKSNWDGYSKKIVINFWSLQISCNLHLVLLVNYVGCPWPWFSSEILPCLLLFSKTILWKDIFVSNNKRHLLCHKINATFGLEKTPDTPNEKEKGRVRACITLVEIVVPIGVIIASKVIFTPLECIPTIPPLSSYVINVCYNERERKP